VILDQELSKTNTLTAHYQDLGSDKDGIIANSYGPHNNQEKDTFLRSMEYLGSLIGQQ